MKPAMAVMVAIRGVEESGGSCDVSSGEQVRVFLGVTLVFIFDTGLAVQWVLTTLGCTMMSS